MTKAQLEVALTELGKELQERRFKVVQTALAAQGGVPALPQADLKTAFFEAEEALHEIAREEYRTEEANQLLLLAEPQGADLESP